MATISGFRKILLPGLPPGSWRLRVGRLELLVVVLYACAALIYAVRVVATPNQDAEVVGTWADWATSLFTLSGVIGLSYQLRQLQRTRIDETTRENNSLVTETRVLEWRRDGTVGSLYEITVRHEGEYKVVAVEARLRNVADPERVSNPISGPEPGATKLMPAARSKAIWGFWINDSTATAASVANSWNVEIDWTDVWGRRIRMIDDGHASILTAAHE